VTVRWHTLREISAALASRVDPETERALIARGHQLHTLQEAHRQRMRIEYRLRQRRRGRG
jgi:hypothetical protein